MKRLNTKGFTMVELLVVLVIIGILAAVATPLFVKNAQKARMSEAMATMSLIRQAQREYNINKGDYFAIKAGNLTKNVPDDPSSTSGGLDIDLGTVQYFSNDAFSVVLKADVGKHPFKNPDTVVDFLIKADGSASVACDATETDCAVKQTDVEEYVAMMDNSGRAYVCYEGCGEMDNFMPY